MEKYIGIYKESDLDCAIRVLENFRYECLDGEYDGWGLDDNMILCVKQWLHNIKDGLYSDKK